MRGLARHDGASCAGYAGAGAQARCWRWPSPSGDPNGQCPNPMHDPADRPFVTADLAAVAPPPCEALPLLAAPAVHGLPAFERPLQLVVREVPLLTRAPWVRPLGKLTMEVTTQGWRFPTPGELPPGLEALRKEKPPAGDAKQLAARP